MAVYTIKCTLTPQDAVHLARSPVGHRYRYGAAGRRIAIYTTNVDTDWQPGDTISPPGLSDGDEGVYDDGGRCDMVDEHKTGDGECHTDGVESPLEPYRTR